MTVYGRLSSPRQTVAVVAACATLWLPTEIFKFDIKPNANGPVPGVMPGVDLAKVT